MKSTITIITKQYCIIVFRFTTTSLRVRIGSGLDFNCNTCYMIYNQCIANCTFVLQWSLMVWNSYILRKDQLRSFKVMSLTWMMTLLAISTYQKQIKPLSTWLWRMVAQDTFLKSDFHKNSFYIIIIISSVVSFVVIMTVLVIQVMNEKFLKFRFRILKIHLSNHFLKWWRWR